MKSQKTWVARLVFSAVASILFLNSTLMTYASSSHDANSLAPLDLGSEPRPQAIPELKQTDAQLLGYYFAWPERVINNKFQETLPNALNSSLSDKVGAAFSPIFSELFWTQTPERVSQIVSAAESLLAKKADTDSETQNKSSSNNMLEKLITAGKWLVGDEVKQTPENDEFLKTFKKDWEEQGQNVATAIKFRDQAIDPNQSEETRKLAKEWLRDNVNRDQVLAFAASQAKNGKEAEAAKWVRAMSWDGFIDFKNNGKPVRLDVGKSDQEIAAALKAYENVPGGANKGMFAMTMNKSQHEGEFKHVKQMNGAIVEVPKPQPAQPDNFAQPDNQVASADTATALAAVRGGRKAQDQPKGPAVQQRAAPRSAASGGPPASYQKYCLSCHGEKPADKSLAAINRGSMPDAKQDPALAAEFRANGKAKAEIINYLNSI